MPKLYDKQKIVLTYSAAMEAVTRVLIELQDRGSRVDTANKILQALGFKDANPI